MLDPPDADRHWTHVLYKCSSVHARARSLSSESLAAMTILRALMPFTGCYIACGLHMLSSTPCHQVRSSSCGPVNRCERTCDNHEQQS